MVLLDLAFAATQGLSSRQNSQLSGSGDSYATDLAERDHKIKNMASKVSHLYLQNKNITKISPAINKLKQLTTLYLYDNRLTNVGALAYAVNLTHVYLQGNDIETTHGLGKLKKLEKIYLAGNKIEVVEDIVDPEGFGNLIELHLEKQRLPKGHQLVFNPECLTALGHTLEILNISGNSITNIDNILTSCHNTLVKLDASYNEILKFATDYTDYTTNTPMRFPLLRNLKLTGNPLQSRQSMKNYRKQICIRFQVLTNLDGKEISDFERRWHLALHNRETQKKSKSATKSELYNEPSDIDNRPPIPEHWRSRGLPGGRSQFDLILAKAQKTYAKANRQEAYDGMGEQLPTSPDKRFQEQGDMATNSMQDALINTKLDFEKSDKYNLPSRDTTHRQINLSAMKLAPIE